MRFMVVKRARRLAVNGVCGIPYFLRLGEANTLLAYLSFNFLYPSAQFSEGSYGLRGSKKRFAASQVDLRDMERRDLSCEVLPCCGLLRQSDGDSGCAPCKRLPE